MKRNLCKIFLALLLLISGFAISASAETAYIEDFQSYPLTDSFGSSVWNIRKTDSSLTEGFSVTESSGDRYLVGSSNSSYIQSLFTIDMSGGNAVVSFKFNADSPSANFSANLRGRVGGSSDNIRLFAASDDGMTFLNDTNTYPTNGWIKVSFVFGSDNSLRAYENGVLKYSLDDYTATYPGFESSAGTAALRIYLKDGAMADDICLYNNISINDEYIISSPVYKINTLATDNFDSAVYPLSDFKKGDITAFMAYTKLSEKPGRIISALYSGDSLQKLSYSDFPQSVCSDIINLSVPAASMGVNDTIKLFNIADNNSLVPMTLPLIPVEPSYIRQYPAELEASFDKGGMHPRIIADKEVFLALKQNYNSSDPWCTQLVSNADALSAKSQLSYNPSGGSILATSREALSRIMTFSLAYHMTSDAKYLNSAESLLNTVCSDSFEDWCRDTHFFSCAEMSTAVAIGYDWLYNDLDSATISRIEDKIKSTSLDYAYNKYNERIIGSAYFKGSGNKNLVYNGAMAITSLAFADIYPAESFTILSEIFECIPEALASFVPDGAWSEGTDYWRYGVNYLSMMMASLESVYGTDFAYSAFDGLDKAVNFIIHMKGPAGYNNFHDSEGASDTPAVFYLADKYNLPHSAAPRINLLTEDVSKLQPLDLIYYDSSLSEGNISNLPLNAYFAGVEAMSMRSSWTDENALFVSAHGGKNSGSHTHIDAGTFVFDYLGERWICDLGRESLSYDSNDSSVTNEYYRISAHGHNVFVINPDDEHIGQDTDADVKKTSYDFDAENSYINYDMTSAYKTYARSASRQFKLNDHKSVLTIIDTVKLKTAQSGKTVEWYFHTDGTVTKVDDNNLMLTKNNKTIYFNVKPKDASAVFTLSAEPAQSPPGQASNDGITRICISATASPDIMLTMKFSNELLS